MARNVTGAQGSPAEFNIVRLREAMSVYRRVLDVGAVSDRSSTCESVSHRAGG